MAKRTRRKHSPAFKTKVALAAMAAEKTLAELAQQYEIHPNHITNWKRQLSELPASVFDGDASTESKVDLKALHAKIGQLILENDFLEGVLTKMGLLSANDNRQNPFAPCYTTGAASRDKPQHCLLSTQSTSCL